MESAHHVSSTPDCRSIEDCTIFHRGHCPFCKTTVLGTMGTSKYIDSRTDCKASLELVSLSMLRNIYRFKYSCGHHGSPIPLLVEVLGDSAAEGRLLLHLKLPCPPGFQRTPVTSLADNAASLLVPNCQTSLNRKSAPRLLEPTFGLFFSCPRFGRGEALTPSSSPSPTKLYQVIRSGKVAPLNRVKRFGWGQTKVSPSQTALRGLTVRHSSRSSLNWRVARATHFFLNPLLFGIIVG